jgi:L-Ala-D/L-Glu epimerase
MSSKRTTRSLRIETEKWGLRSPLRITGHLFTEIEVVVASVKEAEFTGRGEAAGVYYLGDDVPAIVARIESVHRAVEEGVGRQELQCLMPPGGARNALDCALWELEARRSERPVWQIAGLNAPKPRETTFTLSAESPETMALSARTAAFRSLKLKLTGEPIDAERVQAVRDVRPDGWLGVDANQGYTRQFLELMLPIFVSAHVHLIEQPFPVGEEEQILGINSPIPIAADESIQSLDDLTRLAKYFDVVNIKLDKCGGLTEGLRMAERAPELGLDVMVGNMMGTSLAMAPAFLVAQLCKLVDLDGALLLARDRACPARYDQGCIWCGEKVWGSAAGQQTQQHGCDLLGGD